MRFRGSFLVAIGFADGRDALTLRYRNRRLDSVADMFGRTLRPGATPTRATPCPLTAAANAGARPAP